MSWVDAGMQAVCLLGSYLPAGDPRRLGVPKLHAKILARLANPELLLFGGSRELKIEGKPYVAPGYQSNPSHHGVDNGALIARRTLQRAHVTPQGRIRPLARAVVLVKARYGVARSLALLRTAPSVAYAARKRPPHKPAAKRPAKRSQT